MGMNHRLLRPSTKKPAAAPRLVTESGDKITTESGDKIRTEQN